MIQTIKKAWGIPELRKKIVFTALILLIFRIGNAIPVPYVDTGLLGTYINQLSTTVLSLYNVMSGGAFAQATIFALWRPAKQSDIVYNSFFKIALFHKILIGSVAVSL